ncbi:MAG: GDP-mannose 4,6-dehydratase [Bacteroidia bacterium]|nr:GDP-mannose 4,6-dehydratase [Bacteroidia bacterium]
MKILVTGGAGFIASHIVDKLIESGHEVHVLDNLYTGKRENVHPKALFQYLDIVDTQSAQLIVQEKYEVIYHFAAQMDVRKSVEDPTFDAQVNIIGTIHLLEAALKAGTKKFIFASTGGAGYGEQEYFPADEKHPIQPLSPYGIAKMSVEKYLYYYYQVHGLAYVSLRLANIYGPRQNPKGEAGVVAIFCQKLLNDEPAYINGTGLQTRDYVYVSDVVQAAYLALHYPKSGAFNVGTGVETNVIQIFDYINEYTGKNAPRRFAPAKKGEQLRSVLSYQKIHQEMGWQPTVDIQIGLQKTVAWFENKQKSIKQG